MNATNYKKFLQIHKYFKIQEKQINIYMTQTKSNLQNKMDYIYMQQFSLHNTSEVLQTHK
jgi:hypothetical protein